MIAVLNRRGNVAQLSAIYGTALPRRMMPVGGRFYNYTPGFIMDSLGHSDCVIKETLRIKVNAYLKQVFFVNSNRLNTVESKNNYLRYAVGGFLPGTLSIA